LTRIPQRLFVISGIFRSNIFDYDRTRAFIHLTEGKRLFRQAGETQWHLRLENFQDSDLVRTELLAKDPDLEITTWFQQHETLFRAMQLEKWGSFVGLNLIILVAVFNIVSTLIMLVLEKTGEIGILRVMGLTRTDVQRVFQIQGFLVAIFGVLLGVIIGTSLVYSQIAYQWIKLPTDIYIIPALPMILATWEILLVAVMAFVIVILSVRYPAVKAGKLVPVEAINYKK
jgi:lipoprotein-releasing system permease protein